MSDPESPTPSGGTLSGGTTRPPPAKAWEEDERGPLMRLSADECDFAGITPCIRKRMSLETCSTYGLESYTWEETLGDGWRDRDDRFWDPRRPLAQSDTSDYSEAASYETSELSEEEDNLSDTGI